MSPRSPRSLTSFLPVFDRVSNNDYNIDRREFCAAFDLPDTDRDGSGLVREHSAPEAQRAEAAAEAVVAAKAVAAADRAKRDDLARQMACLEAERDELDKLKAAEQARRAAGHATELVAAARVTRPQHRRRPGR